MHPTYVAPFVNQCAEITITAVGLGRFLPNAARLPVKSFFNMMFIGEPWPMNNTGIFMTLCLSPLPGACAFSLSSFQEALESLQVALNQCDIFGKLLV